MLAFLGIAVVVVRVYYVTGMADIERRDALDVARDALASAKSAGGDMTIAAG